MKRTGSDLVPIGEAARRLGLSLDTLRRWERAGRLKSVRGAGNVRMLTELEVDRLVRRRQPARRPRPQARLSARNRLPGVVTELRVSGLLAQVTLDVDGHEVVAVITSDSAKALGLRAGGRAVALIKATHVIIEKEAEP
jgi:molybdopterin-binding protein